MSRIDEQIELTRLINDTTDMIEVLTEKLSEYNQNYHNGWVSCSNRMPESKKLILLQFPGPYDMRVGFSVAGTYYIYSGEKLGTHGIANRTRDIPIAWMPLPDPYEP